jgi:hypothetical protein
MKPGTKEWQEVVGRQAAETRKRLIEAWGKAEEELPDQPKDFKPGEGMAWPVEEFDD